MNLMKEIVLLLVAYFGVICTAPSFGEYEIEKEVEHPFTNDGHPFGEDGLEVPEPNLTPLHDMFYFQFAKGKRACTSSEDCNPGECCVVGMNRYSVPKCQALGRSLELCIPGNQPYNTELYYPGGVFVNVSQIFRLTCPCQQHLECLDKECQPVDSIQQVRNNRVDYIDP